LSSSTRTAAVQGFDLGTHAVRFSSSSPALAQIDVAAVLKNRRQSVSDQAISGIRDALESAGEVFIDENGGGAGVRLRKGTRPKASKKNSLFRCRVSIGVGLGLPIGIQKGL
jgi:hypothetical protein